MKYPIIYLQVVYDTAAGMISNLTGLALYNSVDVKVQH